MYNVTFYEEMKENNIHVLAIPPHTSHLVQALDSTPFAEFKCSAGRFIPSEAEMMGLKSKENAEEVHMRYIPGYINK